MRCPTHSLLHPSLLSYQHKEEDWFHHPQEGGGPRAGGGHGPGDSKHLFPLGLPLRQGSVREEMKMQLL